MSDSDNIDDKDSDSINMTPDNDDEVELPFLGILCSM